MKYGFCYLFLVLVCTDLSRAQEAPPLSLARLSAPIVLDGLSNEAAWEAVEPFPLVQFEPRPGLPPSERTEVRVAYDAEYLYFSLRAYDQDPSGIQGNILYRDRFGSDDYFEVMLDTFNDRENLIVFTTSPTGIRRDTEISKDASGPPGSWINPDFNTYWDAAARVTDEGWFAEMRIPFSSLRFQDVDGRVVMGLTVQRIIARKAERATFPPLTPDVDFAWLKASRAVRVALEGVYSRRPLYLSTYGLTSLARAPENALPGAPQHDMTRDAEGGLDLKYGLTNDLTLDLTVNTDFAQAEADDQQLNLTRFSLFFPEKRPFFLERAGTFDFRAGDGARLFHSRRIGLTEEGLPVRILGGARLVGRVGAWETGLLNMQTAGRDAVPAENFGVLRLRRQVLNPYSQAGGMMTSRIGPDGHVNVAYGLDAVVRVVGDDYLTLQWAQTLDRAPGAALAADPFETGRLAATFERRRRAGIGYSTSLAWSGAAFDPAMGFVQRVGFSLVDQAVAYTWRPGAASNLIYHTATLRGLAYVRNADRTAETVEVGPEWRFARKGGDGGILRAQVVYEDLLHPFTLARGVEVPAGGHTFYRATAGYSMSRSRLLRTDVNVGAGTFYDGWQTSVSASPNWYVSPHLELGGTYLYNRIRFPERDGRLDAHIARLRVGTALNTMLSTHALVQYNSATRSFSANVRFRYNFREGNDLWIVFTHNDWYGTPPGFVGADDQTLLVKYTHTFRL